MPKNKSYLYREFGYLLTIIKTSASAKLDHAWLLLNASLATNFNFKIGGNPINTAQINQINNINTRGKIQDRVKAIYSLGNNLEFVEADNKTFLNNLILIDSLLPSILSHALVA